MSRRGTLAAHVVLALLAYVPLLLTAPGVRRAPTRRRTSTSIPRACSSRASSMWDPNVGMGTVTHQTIGYLWPMGPWYWLFETLGAARLGGPAAVARHVCSPPAPACSVPRARSLGVARPPSGVVAALAYMLSPYVLDYSRPHLGDPAAVGGAAVADRARPPAALRRGGWRHPALFALVVLTVGGVNATALVFAGLGPSLWLRSRWRDARSRPRPCATVAAIGVLTVGAVRVVGRWASRSRAATASRSSATPRRRDRGPDLAGVRGAARPRLLVLLRRRQARSVDRAGASTTPSGSGSSPSASPSRSSPSSARPSLRWRHRGVLRRAGRRRHGRSPSAPTRTTTRRRSAAPSRRWPRRRPSGSPCAARPAPCRSSPSAWRSCSAPALVRAGDARLPRRRRGRGGRRGGAGCLAGLPPLFTGDLAVGDEPQATRGDPDVLAEAAAPPRRAGRRDRGARAARRRLRVVPLGQHRRPDHAGPDGPAVRRPRADPLRHRRHRPTCSTPSTAACRRACFEPAALAPIARLMRRRRRRPAQRPPVRALPHAPSPRPRRRAGAAPRGLGRPTGFGPRVGDATAPDRCRCVDEHELGVSPSIADPSAGRGVPGRRRARHRARRAGHRRAARGRRRRGARRPRGGRTARRAASVVRYAASLTTTEAGTRRCRRRTRSCSPTPTAVAPGGGGPCARTPATPSRRTTNPCATTRPTPASTCSPSRRRTTRRWPSSAASSSCGPPGTATRSRTPPRTGRPTPSTATTAPRGASAPSPTSTASGCASTWTTPSSPRPSRSSNP